MIQTLTPLVARTLYVRVFDVFQSEEAMIQAWSQTPLGTNGVLGFHRTEHARNLLTHLLDTVWRGCWAHRYGADAPQAPAMVDADRIRILAEFLHVASQELDSLFVPVQVVMNLMPSLFTPDLARLKQDLEAVEAEFDAMKDIPHPTKTKKAKVDPTWDEALQAKFRRGIDLQRVSNAFAKFGLAPSYRITPFGKTPALVDTAGLSSLPAIGDDYLKSIVPGSDAVAYASWTPGASLPLTVDGPALLAFGENTLGQRFVSESGGEILGQVLLSRAIAASGWTNWFVGARKFENHPRGFMAIPRMSSVRFVGNRELLVCLEHTLKQLPWLPAGFTYRLDTRVTE